MKFAGTAEATKLALQLLTELFLCLTFANHENSSKTFVDDLYKESPLTSFASALSILKETRLQ